MQLDPNNPTIGLSRGALDVLRERLRQATDEGWTREHDDAHRNGELLEAALCYARVSSWADERQRRYLRPSGWPWAHSWWKPTTRRRDLVKAIALLLAELDRLDRAQEPARAPAEIAVEQMSRTFERITVRHVFANARQIARTRKASGANWVFAMDLFGLGSTYAHEICLRMGIDPDASTATPWPEQTP
ncbi:hypothetical protein [Aureimonas ureilytica]|uniref:hypothetical protein n=1 Tax=Aureimonas ureilytica TaxID=401562 RepID=UPI000734DAA7|nr:hypothetical protein [Aureimonas ureilytica]